jgi:hypothetical protein
MVGKITDWQLIVREGKLLLGLAVPGAILDIESDRETLTRCLRLLEGPPDGARDLEMGRFGPHAIHLNRHVDDTVSIFVDGPNFAQGRRQSAAIWVDKESLCSVLREIAAGLETR